MIAFYDPPKENITQTIKIFRDAGISVKMITGDYPETVLAIARQVQLDHTNEVITGQDVLHFSKEAVQKK